MRNFCACRKKCSTAIHRNLTCKYSSRRSCSRKKIKKYGCRRSNWRSWYMQVRMRLERKSWRVTINSCRAWRRLPVQIDTCVAAQLAWVLKSWPSSSNIASNSWHMAGCFLTNWNLLMNMAVTRTRVKTETTFLDLAPPLWYRLRQAPMTSTTPSMAWDQGALTHLPKTKPNVSILASLAFQDHCMAAKLKHTAHIRWSNPTESSLASRRQRSKSGKRWEMSTSTATARPTSR